jgi:hypothetical protein
MEDPLIVGLIQKVSNVEVVVNEFPIEIHASQEILWIYSVGKCGSILQNLNFGQSCLNSCLMNHKTEAD